MKKTLLQLDHMLTRLDFMMVIRMEISDV